jgi:glycerophosphoryl diester phosphodiesterase
VGHKGADAIAPGNTPASFEAALGAGVDMIEFDVLRTADGRLVLAHDPEDAAGRTPTSLDEGLEHLAGAQYAGVGLDVDLKHPGLEREIVEGLRRHGLEGRALISSTFPESLARVGRLSPGLPRGFSTPRARRDYLRSPLAAPPAYAYMGALRSLLPRRAEAMIRAGRCEAVMAHRLLVTSRLVDAVHRAGGRLFAWTVDDEASVRELDALGVDGVISNDPRLFARRAVEPV